MSHPVAAARADFARAGPRRGRAAQAAPRHPVLRRPARAGSPTALEDDDAPARARMRQPVADRARRRVPGHRPGAVAGARTSVPRPRHADPDRRPEAGDLRLPGRRRRHLPAASRQAGTRATLGTNRRSDAALVDKFNATLGNAGLGTAGHRGPAGRGGTRGLPAGRRARARRRSASASSRRDDFKLKDGLIPWWTARAADRRRPRRRRRRAAGLRTPTWDGDPVEAHHVAVLVADRSTGGWSRRALQKRGVPGRPQRRRRRLPRPRRPTTGWPCSKALDAPHRAPLVRSAALTCFFGHDVEAIVAGGDAAHRRGRRRAAGRCDPRAHPGGRGAGRVAGGARAQQPDPRPGRRRAAAHRPPPPRPAAAPAGGRAAARPDRAARVVPRRAAARRGGGAPAAARLRRPRGADRDDPRQQGPGVPDRLPPLRLRRLRARPADGAVPRPLRPGPAPPAHRRRRERTAVGRQRRRAPRRGGRRGAAQALRRAHPRPVAGRHLVGARRGHRARARCTGCCSAGGPAPATCSGSRRCRTTSARRRSCRPSSATTAARSPSSPPRPGPGSRCRSRRTSRSRRGRSTG